VTSNARARLAGFFYLLVFVTGVVAALSGARLLVAGNPAATATNILEHEAAYRLGFAAFLLNVICYVVVTLLFYEMFAVVSRSVSMLAAFFSLVGCASQAAAAAFYAAPLVLLHDAPFMAAFTQQQTQALTLLSIKLYTQAYNLGLVFFGCYCLLIGYLAYRSTFLPRLVGALMMLAGGAWLTFLWPPLAAAVSPYNLGLGVLGEGSLTLWLLLRGVKESALLIASIAPLVVGAQSTPKPDDWSADDSARIAFIKQHGRSYQNANAILWVPVDSLDPSWLPALADSVGRSVAKLRSLVGAHEWQRIGTRPITYFLSPGRFVSHATGNAAVLIALNKVRQGQAPFLHEASHELLQGPAPYWPDEYPDSVSQAAAQDRFPDWLAEGLPDYLAQTTAAATGFREGDVFEIGGLAKADSVCAARLATNSRRGEILAVIGSSGTLPLLFTTARQDVAPTFYACSQSFTAYLVRRVGLQNVVALFPQFPSGKWQDALASEARRSLPDLRNDWMKEIGVPLRLAS